VWQEKTLGRVQLTAEGARRRNDHMQTTNRQLSAFDHEPLTYRYAGRDFRLKDVSGHVIREILA
jgi:hypothetical protein